MANVKITLHRVPIYELLYAPTGEVHNLVERTTNLVHIATLREAPVMTGAMLATIGKDIRVAPGRSVTGVVSSTDEAALWVQQGTGVYGPRRAPITPRTRRIMRFHGKRDGALLYRAFVDGQMANPFMWRALVRGTILGPQRWTLNRLI